MTEKTWWQELNTPDANPRDWYAELADKSHMTEKTWWQELNTPDANPRDWYAELTNQCGHALLGLSAAALIMCAWFALDGEMPYRSAVAALVLGAYLAVEKYVQGWRPGDSWFDTLMVACGVAASTCPWREMAIDGWAVQVSMRVDTMLMIIAFFAAALFLRVRRRYIASR